jgi:hypothetical protein
MSCRSLCKCQASTRRICGVICALLLTCWYSKHLSYVCYVLWSASNLVVIYCIFLSWMFLLLLIYSNKLVLNLQVAAPASYSSNSTRTSNKQYSKRTTHKVKHLTRVHNPYSKQQALFLSILFVFRQAIVTATWQVNLIVTQAYVSMSYTTPYYRWK